ANSVWFLSCGSFATSLDRLKGTKNQEADFSVRASFRRRSRQLERCFKIQSNRALSKPISFPAFSLSIHLCFKISARSARNSLSRAESLTNCAWSSSDGMSPFSFIRFLRSQLRTALSPAQIKHRNWTRESRNLFRTPCPMGVADASLRQRFANVVGNPLEF